jgi:hypothetical protein
MVIVLFWGLVVCTTLTAMMFVAWRFWFWRRLERLADAIFGLKAEELIPWSDRFMLIRVLRRALTLDVIKYWPMGG